MTLSDTHLVLLSAAAQHPDGLLLLPASLEVAPLKAMRHKLLRLGVVANVPIGREQPAWAETAGGRLGLRITAAGLQALGLEPETESDLAEASEAASTSAGQRRDAAEKSAGTSAADRPSLPGSKIDAVLGLLCRKGGASLPNLVAATGWLPHTIRAALTGLRKKGHTIELTQGMEGERVYRLVVEEPVFPHTATAEGEVL